MKLKKSLKIAKEKCFKCIAVDKNKEIYAYTTKSINSNDSNKQWMFDSKKFIDSHEIIGIYTGSKKWTKTLREVK